MRLFIISNLLNLRSSSAPRIKPNQISSLFAFLMKKPTFFFDAHDDNQIFCFMLCCGISQQFWMGKFGPWLVRILFDVVWLVTKIARQSFIWNQTFQFSPRYNLYSRIVATVIASEHYEWQLLTRSAMGKYPSRPISSIQVYTCWLGAAQKARYEKFNFSSFLIWVVGEQIPAGEVTLKESHSHWYTVGSISHSCTQLIAAPSHQEQTPYEKCCQTTKKVANFRRKNFDSALDNQTCVGTFCTPVDLITTINGRWATPKSSKKECICRCECVCVYTLQSNFVIHKVYFFLFVFGR